MKDYVLEMDSDRTVHLWSQKLDRCFNSLDRPKRLFILINPFGGKKCAWKIFMNEIKPLFEAAKIVYTVEETRYQLHAQEISYKLELQKYNGIVCISGDGILMEMIQLLTFTICGRAYLNFMGNEFGHPNKVEFPMANNNHSFAFANRQWSLKMDKGIHNNLFNFNKDMMKLDEVERVLSKHSSNVHHVDESNMVIAYLKGPLHFVFNFHPEFSYEKYSIGVEEAGEYQIPNLVRRKR